MSGFWRRGDRGVGSDEPDRLRRTRPSTASLDGGATRILGFSHDGQDRLQVIDDSGGLLPPVAAYSYAGPGGRVRRVKRYRGNLSPTPVVETTVTYDHLKRPAGTVHVVDGWGTRSYSEAWGSGAWEDTGETERVGVFQRRSFEKSSWGGVKRE